MNIFHIHRWHVRSTDTQPSAFEQLADKRTTRFRSGYGPDLFEKSVIVTYACACGAEKVERI